MSDKSVDVSVVGDQDRIVTFEDFHKQAVEDAVPEGTRTLVRRSVTDHVCGINEKTRTIDFIISTESVDRMGDTIALDGWDLKAYRKNPVVLFAHDHRSPPIARATRVWRDRRQGALKARAAFVPEDISPFAESIFRLFNAGFMRATSVGFVPTKWVLTEDEGRPFGIDFLEQELIEFSAVPVPANSEALIEDSVAAKGINVSPVRDWLTKALDEGDEADCLRQFGARRDDLTSMLKVIGGLGKRQFFRVPSAKAAEIRRENLERLQAATADDGTDGALPGEVDRGAISYASAHKDGTPKAPKDESWDGPAQVAAAEVSDLLIMCTWRADKPREELVKGDFKLPHHKASSNHAVVWRGVAAAAARLPNTDIPSADVGGVQRHLGRHYGEFDEVAPWDKDAAGWDQYVEACQAGDAEVARGLAEELFDSEVAGLVWPVPEPAADTATDAGDEMVTDAKAEDPVVVDADAGLDDDPTVVTVDDTADDEKVTKDDDADTDTEDQGGGGNPVIEALDAALVAVERLTDAVESNEGLMRDVADSRSGLRLVGNVLGACIDLRDVMGRFVELTTEGGSEPAAMDKASDDDDFVVELSDDGTEGEVDSIELECDSDGEAVSELVKAVLQEEIGKIVAEEVTKLTGRIG